MSRIMISMTDDDIVRLSNRQIITTSGDFNLSKGSRSNFEVIVPERGSIYDQNYFANVRPNVCNCGEVTTIGKYCSKCDLIVENDLDRSKHHAYIASPVWYILKNRKDDFLREIKNIVVYPLGMKGANAKYEFLKFSNWTQHPEDSSKLIGSYEYTNGEIYYSIEGLVELIKIINKPVYNRLLKILNKNILVTSLVSRPIKTAFINNEKELVAHDSSTYFQTLFNMTSTLNTVLEDSKVDVMRKVILSNIVRDEIVLSIKEISLIDKSSKESLMRRKLRMRVNNSSRAPIVPNINLDIDQVGVPRRLAYEMFKTAFITHMIEKLGIDRQQAELRYYSASKDSSILDEFDEWVKTQMVILNRPPTLHRRSISGFRVLPHDRYTLEVHPSIIEGFAADFDGDHMSITAVPSHDRDYVESRISPKYQVFSEKDLSALYKPSHEFLLGLNKMSRVDLDTEPRILNSLSDAEVLYSANELGLNDKIDIDGKISSYGRMKISEIMGFDIDKVISSDKDPYTPIRANNMDKLMRVINKFGNRLDILKALTIQSTMVLKFIGGTTLSLEDLYMDVDPKMKQEIKDIENDPKMNPKVKILRVTEIYNEYIKNIRGNISKKAKDLIESSNRLKDKQLTDIIIPELNIYKDGSFKLNDDSLYDGLNAEEYIDLAVKNRDVIVMKFESVPMAGYLTRQIANLSQGFVYIDEDAPHDKCLELTCNKYMIGRMDYITNDLITESMIGKKVKLNSCIFNEDNFVYRNQVNTFLDYYDEDRIGFSFGTTLTESITQKGLSIKHVNTYRTLAGYYKIFAEDDGSIIEYDTNFIVVSYKNRTELKYYISDNFNINKTKFKKGETIGFIYNLFTPTYKLAQVINLLGAMGSGVMSDKNIFETGECYAPFDGILTYEIKSTNSGKKIFLKINGKIVTVKNANCITNFPLPENSMVKKGDRITSDILKMTNSRNLGNSSEAYLSSYYNFRKQYIEIFNENKSDEFMTEELMEFIYRALSVKTGNGLVYSGVNKAISELPILSQMAHGNVSKVLKNAEGKSIDESNRDDLYTYFIMLQDDE